MRVKCIVNALEQLADTGVKARLANSIHLDGPDENLVIGNTYEVLALDRADDGGLRVYLHSVERGDHPYPYPLEMFNIEDSTFPENWVIGFAQNQYGSTMKRISFPEWASDDRFFEKLVDGDQITLGQYRKQKNS